MSDIQLSLLALGVFIIAGVVVFNWWQERGISHDAAQAFPMTKHDPLMGSEKDLNELAAEQVAVVAKAEINPDNLDVHIPLSTKEVEHNFSENTDFTDTDNEPTLNGDPSTWESLSGAEVSHHDDTPEKVFANEVMASDDFGGKLVNDHEQAISNESLPTEGLSVETTEEYVVSKNLGGSENLLPGENLEPSENLGSIGNLGTSANQMQKENQEQKDTQEHYGEALPTSISSQIDLVAIISFNQTTNGTELHALKLDLAKADKPTAAYGLTLERNWQNIHTDIAELTFITVFTKAIFTIQLADRSGAASKMTLHRFQTSIEAAAKKMGGQVEWLGSSDPANDALQLDEFCLNVDKMIRFHLIQGASGPFTGTKFRGLAESSGLTLSEDGAFHYKNEHGQVLFSVFNVDNNLFNAEMLRVISLRGVIFELDIPRISNCTESFNLMMMAAKKMEASLFAQLIDDNQRVLGDAQVEKIRQQLRMIHAQMIARGIIPGSTCALRLFS